MDAFSNELDVSKQVRTTESAEVNREVDRIFLNLYPKSSTYMLDRAFSDVDRLYRGEFAGYQPCNTAYHDIQHVLEVTLAMARLIDGYERSRIGVEPVDAKLFQLGIVTALFHDCGYIVRDQDGPERNGAEFTLTHVSRGSQFLKEYLPKLGMADLAQVASDLIHFTGYERPVATIQVPGLIYRLLGNLLGSADIIAQMADRCYLEKCRDRLYPEFLAGGLTQRRKPDGSVELVYASGADLVHKTPSFYTGATKRLDGDLEGVHGLVEKHFGGQNLYLEELHKNIDFARSIAHETDASILKRKPPETLPVVES